VLALKSITAQRFDRSLRSESVRNKIKIFETEINVGISNAPIVPNFTVFLLAFELFEKTKDWGSRGREFKSRHSDQDVLMKDATQKTPHKSAAFSHIMRHF
jgi:hypothetical protein